MTSSTRLTWKLVRISGSTLASCVRICILRSPGDSNAPSSLRSELFVDQGEGKVHFLSFHLGRSGFWISKCCRRRISTCCGASSLLYMGLVPSWGLKGSPANLTVERPHPFLQLRLPGKQNKTKKNNPQAVFPGEPLWLFTPFWTELSLLVLLGNHWERRKSSFSWQIT